MEAIVDRSCILYERSKKLIPGGVNSPVRAFQPYPFFVSHAKGSKLYSVDGKEFIDFCMAYGSLLFGHAHPDIIQSVQKQLELGTLYGAPTEVELLLAELINELVPCAEMVRLVNTGTEATMHAIRLARAYTGRKKIVKFEGCYHGAHDYVLVKAGSGATTFGIPTSLGIPEETISNTLVLPFNDPETFEKTIQREGDEIACVILEPVIGNAGTILPKEGYLKLIRDLTKEKGIVLIFDEVITGFRLSPGGAQEYFNVIPDLVTLGKVMGGGFPIAAFAGKREIMELVSPSGNVYQAGTFSGNPISVTAGLAVLKMIKEHRDKIYPRLRKVGKIVRDSLVDEIDKLGIKAQVNSIESMFQIFFTNRPVIDYRSALTSDTQKFMKFHRILVEQGIFVPPSQFETCFLSTAHSDEDISKMIDAVSIALKSVK